MAAAPSACASATTCRPASRVWRRSSPLSEARGACGAPRQRRTASAARRARGRPGPNEEVLMDIAMVGLGRMGGNMARRLLRGGHRVVVWNRTFAKAEELGAEGAEPVRELAGVVAALPQPRVIWLMLPYGDTTQEAIDELVPLLAVDDILIDGGNSPFQDDVRRGRPWPRRASATSTPAPAGASGASRWATASWSAASARPSSTSARSWPRWPRPA